MNQLFEAVFLRGSTWLLSVAMASSLGLAQETIALSQASNSLELGPHGGRLEQVAGFEFETHVTAGGIEVYVRDASGRAVDLQPARGTAVLSLEGIAKRYRYDLLPDRLSGAEPCMAVRVNLSRFGGRQLELSLQLIGLPKSQDQVLQRTELIQVPATADQIAAAAIALQKNCPVTSKALGSMGPPIAVEVDKRQVYVCCASCVETVRASPDKYLAARLDVQMVELDESDQPTIARQVICPVMEAPLGSMGGPIKVMVGNKPMFLCCRGCIRKVKAEPLKFIAKLYETQGSNESQ